MSQSTNKEENRVFQTQSPITLSRLLYFSIVGSIFQENYVSDRQLPGQAQLLRGSMLWGIRQVPPFHLVRENGTKPNPIPNLGRQHHAIHIESLVHVTPGRRGSKKGREPRH